MSVRVCCVSDMHGHFPAIPDCDLLLLGGDYPPTSRDPSWYGSYFAPWLETLSKRMKIIGVAGNWDFPFQDDSDIYVPTSGWTYLEDSGTEWNGFKIWGSPWQPVFYWWAFNAKESDLMKIWQKIPDDTDILLLHGPPYGYGDITSDGHSGSPSLLERIQEIKPKLVIAGHIHSGYGRYEIGDTIFVNASVVNERRQMVNEPIVIDLER